VSAFAIGLASFAGGCGPRDEAPAPAARSFEGVTVALAVAAPDGYDATGLVAALNAQRGEWEANRKGRVALAPQPLAPPEAGRNADVLAFRADLLGDLIDAGALALIPDEAVKPPDVAGAEASPSEAPADPLAFAEILPAFRDQVIRWGEDVMALPVGGSGLVLAYRRDAFEREENQQAATAAGLALEPPKTYAQLDALAKFFHGRDWDGDGADDAGIALALGEDAEGVADAIFLARSAALGKHPDHYSFLFDDDTMEPWIDRPPFVEALAALVALKDLGPGAADAEAARAAFREGRAALLIDRAEAAGRWADPKAPKPLGVASLPGSERVFDPDRRDWQESDPPNRPSYLPRGGGWLVGLSARATGPARGAALDFLRYVAGSEATGRIVGDRDFPVLPTRSTQLGGTRGDARSAANWGRAVAETLTAARVVPGLRIPEADGYLADLARARAGAIERGAAPESALREAAGAWAERTRRLGVERQKWHYRRSLNRPSGSPKPPARGS
jgi:multiple sugar transport system substrate-binding protein